MIDADLNPLTPETRALQGAAGTPVVLADGQTWLLADGGLCNDLDELRDKLDDEARLKGSVSLVDVAEMAAQLLITNYDLAVSEVYQLLSGAINQKLSEAVALALFGPNEGRWSYSAWAASGLLANGINPDNIPSRLMPHVLAHLEYTRRIIPREEYLDSAVAARKLAKIRGRAPRQEPEPEPTAPIVAEGP